MRNLKVWRQLFARLPLRHEDEALMFSAFDVERKRVFFASSVGVLYGVSLSSSQNEELWTKSILMSEDGSVTSKPEDSISALDYLMEKEAVVVGTLYGQLILHTVDCDSTEVVGRVEGGIKSITSSPDGALLAVIGGLGQLLMMTHDWEVLYEVSLDPQLLGDAALDFHGDEFSGHNFESIVSWQGDGKYFATLSGLSGDSSSSKRLKIWERDSGALLATAESNVLGECLAWMPMGAKIAAAQKGQDVGKCHSIVLFEKNGLERSSFSIEDSAEMIVEALKWNCASDLLAVLVTGDRYDAIKVLFFANNHWYLKQEIRYQKMDKVKFAWDPIKPLQMICWTEDGKITLYDFIWVTAITETSTAFVIDNATVLVSPLDVSLIPPPMFLFSLKFSSAVQDIAYYSKNSRNYLAVCLSDGSLCAVELPATIMWEEFEGKEFVIETSSSDLKVGSVRHLTWLDTHVIIGVSSCDIATSKSSQGSSFRKNGSSHQVLTQWSQDCSLLEIELQCSEDCVAGLITSGWHSKNMKSLFVGKPIVGIITNLASKYSAFVQLDGGSIFQYPWGLGIDGLHAELHWQSSLSDNSFSSTCPWMKAALVSDGDVLKQLVFGLDESGRLQVGRKTLCYNCSAFSLYSDTARLSQQVSTHLILTTKQDLLFTISMHDTLYGNPETEIANCTAGSIRTRKNEKKDFAYIWERGANLIGVIHGDEAAVILQPTRGNLECIYPRKLVIVAIANALDQQRFKDAMVMVRRHRIDFNIIVDYCGLQVFLKSAGDFVKQVNNLGHITEFVCAIKNENVLETLYRTLLSAPCSKEGMSADGFNSESKVSCVLLAIRKNLEELISESSMRELCILTTLARSEPPALEEALRRIKVIRESELQGTDEAHKKTLPSAEEALKHLLWLSNAMAVYDAALGLYDLNLAAIVALNSDKDPKEFIPFLQQLENLPPVIMKYRIDLRLKRFDGALKHIASAGDNYFGDCMELLNSNPELFPLGLQLFPGQAKRCQVLEAWGDHLYEEKNFEDSAMTYMCCSSLQKALKAYRACGNWKGVLTVAGMLKLKKKEVLQLASELCDELQSIGKPAEAARITLEYCNDIAGGVGYFIMAREWQEALRISYLHEREDLVLEVNNAATECASSLMIEYEEGSEKVGKYLARYLAIRQRRLLLAAKLQSEGRSMDDFDDDNISEASSNFSGMSAYTMGTTKGSGSSVCSSAVTKGRQMRRQRKGGKIRAGSPGEELALVEHLKGMSLTDGAQSELKCLLVALVMLAREETAQKLQRVADSFQQTQIAAVRLAEDTVSTEKIDESTQTLDYYIKKSGQDHCSSTASWQSNVLVSR